MMHFHASEHVSSAISSELAKTTGNPNIQSREIWLEVVSRKDLQQKESQDHTITRTGMQHRGSGLMRPNVKYLALEEGSLFITGLKNIARMNVCRQQWSMVEVPCKFLAALLQLVLRIWSQLMALSTSWCSVFCWYGYSNLSPHCREPWGGVWWPGPWRPQSSWHFLPSQTAYRPSAGCSHWTPVLPGSNLKRKQREAVTNCCTHYHHYIEPFLEWCFYVKCLINWQ